jgi:hypothetical protein
MEKTRRVRHQMHAILLEDLVSVGIVQPAVLPSPTIPSQLRLPQKHSIYGQGSFLLA